MGFLIFKLGGSVVFESFSEDGGFYGGIFLGSGWDGDWWGLDGTFCFWVLFGDMVFVCF